MFFRFTLTAAAVALSLCAVQLGAQVVYTYDVTSPGAVEQYNLDSAAFPDGGPSFDPAVFPGPTPNAGLLPPAIFPAGAQAADDVSRIIYTTDGFAIAMDYDPVALKLGPPGPPLPPPVFLGIPFGPITGLAFDSAAGILWAADAIAFIPLAPVPPFAPLAPPTLWPAPIGATGPIVGLGVESSTGTLWAVDAGGFVFNLTPAGVPVGPQPVTVVASIPGFLFNGLTVNTSNGPGSFAATACSPRTGGQHVVVTDGVFIYDAVPGISPPIPVAGPTTSGLGVVGLAYCSDPQYLGGFTGCPSAPGLMPTTTTTLANWVGPGAFNGLVLSGAPPSFPVTIIADLCPIPGGAAVPMSGETLWVSPFSPSFVTAGVITDAAGTAVLPIPFVIAPAGIEFTFQFYIADPLAPLGACLCDANHIMTGLP